MCQSFFRAGGFFIQELLAVDGATLFLVRVIYFRGGRLCHDNAT